MIERDSVSCGHCNRLIFVKPGTAFTVYLFPQLVGPDKEEMGASCRVCMRHVCLTCNTVGTCTPLERRIEQMEARGRMLRSLGLALVMAVALLLPVEGQFIAGDKLTGTTPAAGSGPQDYGDYTTLKMILPTTTGSGGASAGRHHTSNRIYRAYTGIPYQFRAVCRGGDWPYTWSLSNAPSGMTITAGPATVNGLSNMDGYISWPSPAATASNITARCTDRDGDFAEQTWSVTVSTTIGADGFCFVDRDSGSDSTGNGSLANPYATLAKLKEDPLDACARAVVYLRGAPANTLAYDFTGFTLAGNTAEFREDRGEPVILIGYPGDSRPIIDSDDHNPGTPLNEIYLRGNNIWIQDIHQRDAGLHGFNIERQGTTNGFGAVFFRNEFTGGGPGVDSSNTAYMFFTSQEGNPSYHDIVVNNDVHDAAYGESYNLAKMYSMFEAVLADNDAYDFHSWTGEADGVFSTKDSVADFTIRNNYIHDIPTQVPCLGGSQNADPFAVRGEYLFNNCVAPGGFAMHLGEFGNTTTVYSYRNTYQGTVQIGGPGSIDTGDGPFTFIRDVMVNSGGSGGSCPQRITCSTVTDYSVISIAASVLLGLADGSIVSTTTGLLQGSNLTNYGPSTADPRGHALQ
jgi:hypothetical protein